MATKAQFKHKKTLGDMGEFFVYQLIEKEQGIRWGHGEAMEEGSDIAYKALNGRIYGVEAKAIRSFLTRDNTGLLTCGAIPFEIMNKDQTEQGWLYKWLFPGEWQKQKEKEERPAVKPERVHFVLYDNDVKRRYPFCVISFNANELFYYLKEAGKEWGWNIFDLSSWSLDRLKAICNMGGKTEIELPAKNQYIVKGKSDGEEAAFCWYVPTNKIISAAEKITMVGDQPPIVQRHLYEKKHPIPGGDAGFQALQQSRYDYLHQHSKGREITNAQVEDERKKIEIYKNNVILSFGE